MVKLRLTRIGRKKRPYYRIVAVDSRKKRDGAFLDRLGYYHPLEDPAGLKIDADKALKWLRVGAQPSNTVRSLLRKEGVWYRFLLEKRKLPAAQIESLMNEWFESKSLSAPVEQVDTVEAKIAVPDDLIKDVEEQPAPASEVKADTAETDDKILEPPSAPVEKEGKKKVKVVEDAKDEAEPTSDVKADSAETQDTAAKMDSSPGEAGEDKSSASEDLKKEAVEEPVPNSKAKADTAETDDKIVEPASTLDVKAEKKKVKASEDTKDETKPTPEIKADSAKVKKKSKSKNASKSSPTAKAKEKGVETKGNSEDTSTSSPGVKSDANEVDDKIAETASSSDEKVKEKTVEEKSDAKDAPASPVDVKTDAVQPEDKSLTQETAAESIDAPAADKAEGAEAKTDETPTTEKRDESAK